MSKLPSMPLFVDAYLADTTHLSLEEHGAYLLLLMAMWRRGGAIPDDDKDNARMLGLMPRAYLRLKPRLMPLLSAYGSNPVMLTQKRLQKEWNYSVENRERQSAKGKAGAKERWEREQALRSSRGIGTGNGRQIAPIPNKNKPSTSLQHAETPEDVARRLETPLLKARG